MKQSPFLFYLLLLLVVLGTTHNSVYNQCILFINQDFHAESYKIKLTLTIYFVAILLCRSFMGMISDSYGGRKCLLISLTLALAGHLFASVSSNIDELIVSRFFQGLGLGGCHVISLVLLMQIFQSKRRASIIANEQVLFSIASVFLPLMSNSLSRQSSWRFTFVVYFIFSLFVFIYFLSLRPLAQANTVSTQQFNKEKTSSLLKNSQFALPVFIACLSTSGYILWLSYFSLLVHNFKIDLKYLLLYQWIPILPFFACSLFFKKLTANRSEKSIQRNILWWQIAAFGMITCLIFYNKNHFWFKYLLLLPVLFHNFSGSFLRPIMQEKALNSVPNHKVGVASSIISITQVAINALFSVVLNITQNFVQTFVGIECLISGSIIVYLFKTLKNAPDRANSI